MAGKRKKQKSKKQRRAKRIILGIGVVLGIGMAWNGLRPLMTEGSIPVYEAFMVEAGDIETTMSFGATIEANDSQSVMNESGTSFTSLLTVREIFVKEAQRVSAGDKLIQLSNGDIYTADIDGTVNEIRVVQGDTLRPNAVLMEICDIATLKMTMNVDEYDIGNLFAGQACSVTVLPLGVTFETTIEHVNRMTTSMGWGAAAYQITAQAPAPDNVLPGMQATVTILENGAYDVPTLAMEALAFDEAGEAYVYKKDAQGNYVQARIETGLNDGMRVQVVSGGTMGDEVWAITGTQTIEPIIRFADLYKHMMGETVIINDKTQSGRGGNRNAMMPGGALPEGMTLPEGFAPPEGIEMPEGMEMPTGMTTPGEAFGNAMPSIGEEVLGDGQEETKLRRPTKENAANADEAQIPSTDGGTDDE